VFFSEDEAPPGEQLDGALRSALHRSKTLVVIANRGTLGEPRWVRTEVEAFRARHPSRPIVAISVGGALQDAAVAVHAREWLSVDDKIWLDESHEAVERGFATDAVVERLATAPTRFKSNVSWRWVVRAFVVSLALLAIALGVATKMARDSASERAAELRRATSLRLGAEAPLLLSGAHRGGDGEPCCRRSRRVDRIRSRPRQGRSRRRAAPARADQADSCRRAGQLRSRSLRRAADRVRWRPRDSNH
jgi:hypothetical protein